MKHKRLNRDGWGFQYYPYYQMRIDEEYFHGIACLIRLTDGEANYWETPKAGRIQVTGAGMTWLELIPDNTNRVITVKYFPDGTHDKERIHYPAPANEKYQPSIWYVDITDGVEFDECGIAIYIDKYLDVIFTPEGDVKMDDLDELDAAYRAGELSKEQYEEALAEGDKILEELCTDISQTDKWCAAVRQAVEDRIAAGEPVKMCREVLEKMKLLMIKEIKEDELEECVKVIRESFMTVADEFGFSVDNAPRFTAFATTVERLVYQLKEEGRQMYACYDETNKIIGYYSLASQKNGEYELNNLCVLPGCRHNKIGMKLLENACANAETLGAEKINIGIVEENRVLRKWYEENGFVHIGTKKFDFFPFTCGYMEKEL